MRHFGGAYVDIVLTGDTFDDAYHAALHRCESDGLPFIHPFDDLDVMAGQGTVGLEMWEQCPEPLEILLVAVGGGGLLSGVGSYFKQVSPQTMIIAVESEGAPALHASLHAGQIVTLDHIDSFADGIAVKRVGDQTFEICKEIADEIILVPEGHICSTAQTLQ